MNKKLDTMTVISIVLIVINLVVFLFLGVNSSCEPEFVNGASLLNFCQLFGGIVYAMPIKSDTQLNGVLRCGIRYRTNDKLFCVFNINCMSNSKICGSKY